MRYGRCLSCILLLLGASAEGRPRLAPLVRLHARGLLPTQPSDRLPLLVRVPGGALALRRAGHAAREISPSVAALSLGPAELSRLTALPGLIAVDAQRRLRPLLDRSLPQIGAHTVHAERGLRGRGTLIAIIDTGLDLRHPDFRGADGATRVRWLLDARSARGGLHPELPDYGGMAVYDARDIDRVLRAEEAGLPPPLALTQADESGHGTHVAGIACGNGRATSMGLPAGRYVGVAPEASLCVVQASRNGDDFADEDVLTGVRFCLDRGRDEGMPVVINLSLGGMGGPHDGSTVLEEALDELIADQPGRALVVAAGNSGGQDSHAGAYGLDGEARITMRLGEGRKQKSGRPSRAGLDLYFEGAGPLSLTLLAPSGESVGPVALGESARGEVGEEGGRVRVVIENGTEPEARRRSARVELSAPIGERTPRGELRVILSGRAARYDAWLGESSEDLSVSLSGNLDIDGHIELPATARQAISVGSYSSRLIWRRRDGLLVEREREELFAPSYFTAAGPSADGRFAPDLSAPGEYVASALSRDASPEREGSAFHAPLDPGYLWADDGVHALLRGTSQAAPHVTGAIALLFEADPSLRTGRLREILRVSAVAPRGYSTRLGFGRLDVARALSLLVDPRRGAACDPERSGAGLSRDLLPPHGGETTISVTPRDRDGAPLGAGLALRIEAAGGLGAFTGEVRDLLTGRYERTWRGALPSGSALSFTVFVGEVELAQHPVVRFANRRADVAGPERPTQAAGCQAGGRPAPGIVLVLLPGLLFRFRRRRASPRAKI